jgi:hypothetical protein
MKFSPILFASFVAFASFTMCVDDAIAGGGDPLKGINVGPSPGAPPPSKPCGKLIANPGPGGVTGNNGQPDKKQTGGGRHGKEIKVPFDC